MNTKWHEETRADAERVISSDPANAMAWHSLGNALSALDQPGEADACYERALALAPDSAQMWKRGLDTRSAMTELKVRAAEADLERRLTLNPRDVDAVAVHAGALALLMRFEEASQACDRALGLDPDHIVASRVGIHSRLHGCDWRR